MKPVDCLFASVLILSLCTRVLSIDCWVCTSADSGCGESIDDDILQDNKKTASGCSGCGKTFKSLGTIWYEVERTCLTTATDTCDNKLGYGECTCSTTFCNGQNRICMQTFTMLLIFFLALFIL